MPQMSVLTRSRLIFSVILLSSGSSIISATLFGTRRYGAIWQVEGPLFLFPLAIGLVALIVMLITNNRTAFRLAQGVRYLCTPLCFFSLSGLEDVEFLLLAGLLLEAGILEMWPINLYIGLTATTLSIVIRIAVMIATEAHLTAVVQAQVPFALMGYIVAILASRMIRFREAIIDTQRENTTLKNLAVRLSQLNTQYQSAAISATEMGQYKERMRISRDIHDIVGYTLTNNIMLMETAMDLIQENPFGVPSLIESARANAEEGLARIRTALYDLRKQDNALPEGIIAIYKLIRVFSEATGVEVGINALGPSMKFPKETDSALYHLVQESLINALRHGKANKVDVMIWNESGNLLVQVRDNGFGSQKFAEGIGLSGMRERIERLGGRLTYNGDGEGFVVRAQIPLLERKDESESAIVDC